MTDEQCGKTGDTWRLVPPAGTLPVICEQEAGAPVYCSWLWGEREPGVRRARLKEDTNG